MSLLSDARLGFSVFPVSAITARPCYSQSSRKDRSKDALSLDHIFSIKKRFPQSQCSKAKVLQLLNRQWLRLNGSHAVMQ